MNRKVCNLLSLRILPDGCEDDAFVERVDDLIHEVEACVLDLTSQSGVLQSLDHAQLATRALADAREARVGGNEVFNLRVCLVAGVVAFGFSNDLNAGILFKGGQAPVLRSSCAGTANKPAMMATLPSPSINCASVSPANSPAPNSFGHTARLVHSGSLFFLYTSTALRKKSRRAGHKSTAALKNRVY